MSPCISRLRDARLKSLLLLPLTLAAFAAGASPAAAAVQQFSATDSVSDKDPKVADTAFEITSATATYDPDAGSGTVVVNTVGSLVGKDYGLSTTFGHLVNGLCSPPVDEPSTEPNPPVLLGMLSAHVSTPPGVDITAWQLVNGDGSGMGQTTLGTKTTVTTNTDPSLKNLGFECVRIELQAPVLNEDSVLADAIQLAPGTGSAPGPVTTPVPVVKSVVTTEPDADLDGVADASDACPKVPGAAKNGCAAVAAKNEFRLGAKRVVFDRLTKRAATAKVCPAKAAAIVTAKGKRLGKTVVAVETHGDYCYLKGVVKLKKRSKKVRITVKGTGMTSVAKTLKR